MPEQTTQKPEKDVKQSGETNAQTDTQLRRLREYVAAGLAILIVVMVFVYLTISFMMIDRQANTRLADAKDLLQMVFPLVTFVLGYYFNKVSTEARAESAEATAQTAVTTAQQATEGRNEAVQQAEAANQKAEQVTEALTEVGDKAEAYMAAQISEEPKGPGTLSAEGASDVEAARRDFMFAWERAKRLVEKDH
jgi:hypothetical protein